MKMRLLSLLFSLACIGTLKASTIDQSSFFQTTNQNCLCFCTLTKPHEAKSNACIEIFNCNEDSSIEIIETTCPPLFNSSSATSEECKVWLKVWYGGMEYLTAPDPENSKDILIDHALPEIALPEIALSNLMNITTDSDSNSYPWSQAYHYLGYAVHTFEVIRKLTHITQDGLTVHNAFFMTCYLTNLAIHPVKISAQRIMTDLYYLPFKISQAISVIVAGIAYKYDCNCGGGNCCSSRTTFQKIYRYVNPHTIMMVMHLSELMGFTE